VDGKLSGRLEENIVSAAPPIGTTLSAMVSCKSVGQARRLLLVDDQIANRLPFPAPNYQLAAFRRSILRRPSRHERA